MDDHQHPDIGLQRSGELFPDHAEARRQSACEGGRVRNPDGNHYGIGATLHRVTDIDAAFIAGKDYLDALFAKAPADLDRAWLLTQSRNGSLQVWGASQNGRLVALCFVRFENWGGETVARVMALCGERMGEWIGLLEPLRQVLSQMGATRIVAEGRKGWQRRFKVIRQVYEI